MTAPELTAPPIVEPLRPFRGPNFERVARLPIPGVKRKKLLALLAAFTDAGRSGSRTVDLARQLGWKWVATNELLAYLQADGYVVRTKKGRWRLADDIALPAPRRRKPRRRLDERP